MFCDIEKLLIQWLNVDVVDYLTMCFSIHFLQYYAFSLFAMGLNELEENMKSFLAPTDCRYRPDIRALENGDLGKNFLLIILSFKPYHYSVFIQLRQQSKKIFLISKLGCIRQ